MKAKNSYLLIGSTGFLGSSFAFLGAPDDVSVLPVTRQIFDFTNPENLSELEGVIEKNRPSAAIVTASIASPDEALKNPELSDLVNVTGTIRLFKFLKAAYVKPVFYSTDHVYDGQKGHYDESDSYCPVTLYGRQKVLAEESLKSQFSDYLILRTSKQVATRVDKKNILSEMLLKLLDDQEIRCATDHWIAPSFVEDIVPMTYAAIEQNLSGPFHVAPESEYSRIEIGRLLAGFLDERLSPEVSFEKLVKPCSIQDFKFLEVRPPKCTLNGSKLQNAVGHKMMDLREGISRTFEAIATQPAQFQSHNRT